MLCIPCVDNKQLATEPCQVTTRLSCILARIARRVKEHNRVIRVKEHNRVIEKLYVENSQICNWFSFSPVRSKIYLSG